jgi:hypothetical protein
MHDIRENRPDRHPKKNYGKCFSIGKLLTNGYSTRIHMVPIIAWVSGIILPRQLNGVSGHNAPDPVEKDNQQGC